MAMMINVWNNVNHRHLDIIVALRFYITRLSIVKGGTAWHHCCCPYQMWLANMQDSTTQSILSIQRCSNQTEGTTDILSCSSITQGSNNPFKKKWKKVASKFCFSNVTDILIQSILNICSSKILLFYENIARIANAVQVTICLLVSASVY